MVMAFYNEGNRPCDKLRLGLAGLARGRPFGKGSLYGSVMCFLAGEVVAKVKKAGNLLMRLDLRDLVDTMVFEEIVIEEIYPLQNVPFTPDLVVDAGSCRGMFSLIAHARFPVAKLVAIEPVPDNAKRVRKHFQENNIPAEVIEAAVTTDQRPVTFTGAGFGGHIGGAIGEGGFSVKSVSLVDILAQHNPARLLLKMDIEGAEKEVLPAVIEHLPPQTVIFLETHHTESDCSRYLAGLRDVGFSEVVIRRRPSEEVGAEYVERIFVRR